MRRKKYKHSEQTNNHTCELNQFLKGFHFFHVKSRFSTPKQLLEILEQSRLGHYRGNDGVTLGWDKCF